MPGKEAEIRCSGRMCGWGGGAGEVDFKVHGLEELLGKMLPFTGS